MIIADSCVWAGHWDHGETALARLLREGRIALHQFIIGELALGPLDPRAETLARLETLPMAAAAEHDEVMSLIERERLWQSGIGWVDCHLLAAARLGHHSLWTFDRALAHAARRLGIAFLP